MMNDTKKEPRYFSLGAHTATFRPLEDGSWSLDVVELVSSSETETSYKLWGEDVPASDIHAYIPALLEAGWKEHASQEDMQGFEILKPVTGELREQVQGEDV